MVSTALRCWLLLLAAAVAIAVAVASNDATPPVWQHYHYQVRLLFADIQVFFFLGAARIVANCRKVP